MTKIFSEKVEWKKSTKVDWPIIILFGCLVVLSGQALFALSRQATEIERLQHQNTLLKTQLQSQYMVWEMSDSCYQQLRNSDILRLQIQK